jgi:DNA-binding SARP family transcriptional activator
MHMEMSLHQRSMHIMKDGLEPFHLVGIARCASRGMSLFPLDVYNTIECLQLSHQYGATGQQNAAHRSLAQTKLLSGREA